MQPLPLGYFLFDISIYNLCKMLLQRYSLSPTFELHDDFMHYSLLSYCFQILALACSFQHCMSLFLSLPRVHYHWLLLGFWLSGLITYPSLPWNQQDGSPRIFLESVIFFFSAAFLCYKSSMLFFKSELFINHLFVDLKTIQAVTVFMMKPFLEHKLFTEPPADILRKVNI